MGGFCLFSHVTLLAAVVSGEFHLQTQDSKKVSEVGADVFLPCTLSSPQNLAQLNVHWFRSHYHLTVFLLENGKENKERQSPKYSGRATLRAHPDSGDLTLKLYNVSLSDADTYHCLVQNMSSNDYKEAVIELIVIGTGSVPVLGISLQDNSIGVSLVTSDWFPSPEMHWKVDGGGTAVTDNQIIRNQSNGMFQLESRILLKHPHDGSVYGAVRHPVTGKEVGLYMEIAADMFPRLSAWFSAFIVTFLILTAGAIFTIIYIQKQHRQKADLQQALGTLSSEVAWRQAVMTPEYITLCPETAHPELSVAPDFLTLINGPPQEPPNDLHQSHQRAPNDSRFETERCCLGLPAFTTGCHYWEVELGNCLEWAVGVASPEVRRRGHAFMFSPQEHIWCISRFVEDFKALDTPEAPLLMERKLLQKVGVYLKLSSPRKITFYDPTSWNELYTFNNVGHTRGSVLPFFWLGRTGDMVKLIDRGQQYIQRD